MPTKCYAGIAVLSNILTLIPYSNPLDAGLIFDVAFCRMRGTPRGGVESAKG